MKTLRLLLVMLFGFTIPGKSHGYSNGKEDVAMGEFINTSLIFSLIILFIFLLIHITSYVMTKAFKTFYRLISPKKVVANDVIISDTKGVKKVVLIEETSDAA